MSTTHHTESEIARLEKGFQKEEKADIAAVKQATKDLKNTEKALHKAEKVTDKTIHNHDRTLHTEHKLESKMHDAINAHEQGVKREKEAAKAIAVKQDQQRKTLEQVDVKKAALARAEERKETNATQRDARFQALSATTATGPSAA